MTRYEWTPAGLVPTLSEKLELGREESADDASQKKNASSSSSSSESEDGATAKRIGVGKKRDSSGRVKEKGEGRDDAGKHGEGGESPRKKAKRAKMETVWSRMGKLPPKENARLSKLLSHLSLRLDKSTFDFERDGTIHVQGRQVPGSDILKILQSATSKSGLEIGEVLILHLLAHSPRSIRKLVHKKKLHFTRTDELDPDSFSPVLRADRLGKRGAKKGTPKVAKRPRKKSAATTVAAAAAAASSPSGKQAKSGGGGILTSEKDVPGKVNVSKKDVFPRYLPTRRSNALTNKASLPGDDLSAGLGRPPVKNQTWYLLSKSTAVKPSEFIA